MTAARGLEQRRPEAHEPHLALEPSRYGLLGVLWQVAGKYRRLGVAVEGLAADGFAGRGVAGDAGQLFALLANRGLAGGANCGQRGDVDLGAAERGAPGRLLGELTQDRFEPVVRGVVQEIGLGGGKQDAFDAPAE